MGMRELSLKERGGERMKKRRGEGGVRGWG